MIPDLPSPHLLFLGDITNPLDAKTAMGLRDWCPERCVGQWSLPGCAVDLGLPSMAPDAAVRAGARSVIVGVAPSGGALQPHWVDALAQASASGLDLISGLHHRLAEIPALARAAKNHGQLLIDVRIPPKNIPLATGQPRSGKRLLTVGTDCCVGKKYTALAMARAMRERGIAVSFRATGQTGILIAGRGIPLDAVVADFLAGAAEVLTPHGDPEHWDVIEGQGSLFHPAYAAVTLGLIHGSQPDALVLCHGAGRVCMDEYENYVIPTLSEAKDHYEGAARLTNPAARVIGVSLNTEALDACAAQQACAEVANATGLPCIDPMRHDLEPLLAACW